MRLHRILVQPSIVVSMSSSSNRNVSSVSLDNIILTSTNSVSVLICLLAAILVFGLKLYKKAVYRLALYQVLSSLALATVEVLQILFVNYSTNPQVYERVCTTIGYLELYTDWVKLLFTMWVAFHIFCFGVFQKNLKKLEVLYIVTSLLIPAVIASIPLMTNTYGRSPGGATCYIYAKDDVKDDAAFIERFALWDGPAMAILLASSTAMVVLVIKLTSQVCQRSSYEPITEDDRVRKAIKQLLPLAAFPILFFIFEIPLLIFHIYVAKDSTPRIALDVSSSVFVSLWGMSSGATLFIHICIVMYGEKKICFRNCTLTRPQTGIVISL